MVTESVGESLFPPDMGRFDGGAASNLVLFMFLTALTGATAMVGDREMGLDTRIVSTPTSIPRLISGYVAGQFGITFFQGVYIMVLSLAIFGVSWSNLGGSILLVMALSLAGAGAGMLLGSFRLAEATTIGIGVTSGLVLGALGGAMVPLEVLPDTVKTVARFTPQGWAMLGFRDLQWEGSLVGIVDNLAVLVGMGVVLTSLASLSLRRTPHPEVGARCAPTVSAAHPSNLEANGGGPARDSHRRVTHHVPISLNRPPRIGRHLETLPASPLYPGFRQVQPLDDLRHRHR